MLNRLQQITTLARASASAAYWSLLRKAKAGDGFVFPAAMIHPRSQWIKDQWELLVRGADDEEWSKEAIRLVSDNSMVTYDGALSLIDQVRYCEQNDIPGDYVELGTWKGGCLALMAMANMRYGKRPRQIHGFDSFQGMPPRDPERDNDHHVTELPPGALTASQDDVRRILGLTGYPTKSVRLHQGWFCDTVPNTPIKDIAILRIDGDFYEAYKTGLTHLFDRVVPGGFVIFDDWLFNGCRQAVAEFFAARKIRPYVCFADATVRYFQITSRAASAA